MYIYVFLNHNEFVFFFYQCNENIDIFFNKLEQYISCLMCFYLLDLEEIN